MEFVKNGEQDQTNCWLDVEGEVEVMVLVMEVLMILEAIQDINYQLPIDTIYLLSVKNFRRFRVHRRRHKRKKKISMTHLVLVNCPTR